MAEANIRCMAYPKIQSADELFELIELMEQHGSSPDIFALIETSGSVINLREIAQLENVVGLICGPGDLSVDVGLPLYEEDGSLNTFFQTTKHLTVLASVANGLASADIAYCPDIRDLDEVRRRVMQSRKMGFTGMAVFYPPHVSIINDVFTPTPDEVSRASELVGLYEDVIAEGRPAALTEGGETILVHDYEKAKSTLVRAKLSTRTSTLQSHAK